MTLKTRLDRLEAQHAGPVRIWVTYDGETYQSYSESLRQMETLSRAQLDTRQAGESVTILRVVYDESPKVNP